jgi:hypothetical protein
MTKVWLVARLLGLRPWVYDYRSIFCWLGLFFIWMNWGLYVCVRFAPCVWKN